MMMPWKTASQSLFVRLEAYNQSPYDRFFHFNPYLNRVVHQHVTLADFSALPESAMGLAICTFARNPYDRAYSGFRQLQKDLAEQWDATYPEPWIRDLVRKQLTENRLQLEKADYDFDRWVDGLTEDQVLEAGRNSNFVLHPVHYWSHVAGEQRATFIGRVENFEEDFLRLLDMLDIPPEGIEARNSNVDEEAPTAISAYKYPSRMSGRSIDKINALFASDFELFDYERLRS